MKLLWGIYWLYAFAIACKAGFCLNRKLRSPLTDVNRLIENFKVDSNREQTNSQPTFGARTNPSHQCKQAVSDSNLSAMAAQNDRSNRNCDCIRMDWDPQNSAEYSLC